MSTRRYLLVAACLSCLAANVSGQQRPKIRVVFTLQEQLYRGDYSAQDLQRIERGFAGAVARLLSDRIPFAQFDTASSPERTLVISLDKKDRGSNAHQQETGLFLHLASAAAPGQDRYWRTFRPVEDYLAARGSPAAFLKELQSRLEVDDLEILQDVLRSVPIATDGRLLVDPIVGVVWILPFKRNDMCMDVATTLRVANTIRSAVEARKEFRAQASGDYNPSNPPVELQGFRGNLVGLPIDSTDLAMLRAAPAGSVIVSGVFVDHYHRSDVACSVAAAPDSTSFPPTSGGRP
jgi:hypothetical protein